MNNKDLIEKYPFLKIETGCDIEYCWLDDFEPGWRKAFGEDFCNDLLKALKEDGCLNEFEFMQIKEKFGSLRLYASGYPINGKVNKVLNKYEDLSSYICGHCGKPATKITRGWIYPICDECIKEINSAYSNIEDFYNFDSYEKVLEEIEKIKKLEV